MPSWANRVLIQVPFGGLCYVASYSLCILWAGTSFWTGTKNNLFPPYQLPLHVNTRHKKPKISFEVVPASDTVPQYNVTGDLFSLCQAARSLAVWKTIWGISGLPREKWEI